MVNKSLEKLRFPIGKFIKPEIISSTIIANAIEIIENFVKQLEKEVIHLSNSQLETAYRPKGWTIRQVIHHCVDSHSNCFIRIKWTLTEENPIIKFYHENLWSEGIDNRTMPIEPSLQQLAGLHFRLAFIMRNLSQKELEKTFIHPEYNQVYQIKEVICLYAWHCSHHLAHITELKKRKKWQ